MDHPLLLLQLLNQTFGYFQINWEGQWLYLSVYTTHRGTNYKTGFLANVLHIKLECLMTFNYSFSQQL